MSGPGRNDPPNRTVVFRQSPLQEMKQAASAPAAPQAQKPSSVGQGRSLSGAGDEIAAVPRTIASRNRITAAASSLLALLASIRSGRATIELPRLHGMVVDAIGAFGEAIRPHYPEEIQRRATYALCATADDIVLNLPGQERDVAEWARRSIVVHFFRENIGGDRFWVLLDQMIADPGPYADVVELYHACMACGFEGRYRVTAAGRAEHLAKMQRVYQALRHPRELSATELSPRWRGILTEVPRMAFWTPLVLAGAAAALLLVLVYVAFRVALLPDVAASQKALEPFNSRPAVALWRSAPVTPPPSSGRLRTLQTFLAPQIRAGLVQVFEDPAFIRVRMTRLHFDSAKVDLKPADATLVDEIAAALNKFRPGPVVVEGYTDNVRISTALYPDNITLSKARATTVADRLKSRLDDASHVGVRGLGEANPVRDNTTAENRAANRRVEIVIQRQVRS